MKSCLIVDDASVIRKVARRILEDLGYAVIEAENGQQALERCRSERPDVILLDWHMPLMNSIEVLTGLRSATPKSGRRPYVIYCTTENDVGDIARACAAGADDYLLKPFDRAMLEAKLADMKAAA